MPLTAEARLKETEEAWRVVDITRYPAPKASLANYELRCPECKSPMHIRSSLLRITHFAHNPGPPRDCALRNGETIRHLYAKIAISEKLQGLPQYQGAEILKEAWIPEVNRRADILVRFPDGVLEVHEVQLASITLAELRSRTHDYRRAGVHDIAWWFGGEADHQSNREWALEHCGGYGTLDFSERTVEILSSECG